jgi:hypothetical protein
MEVSYTPPVKERLFLGPEWGVSDVRGPYLIKNPGCIYLPNDLLHRDFCTDVKLIFGLSNRSPYHGIEVICRYLERVSTNTILQNDDVEISAAGILRGSQEFIIITVQAMSLNIGQSTVSIEPVSDLLAINKITLERSASNLT